jgi:RNA-binding protein YhbY
MSIFSQAKFQIGKNGLTEGTIESLTNVFKTHKQVRVSVLKSCCRDRAQLEEISKELVQKFPFKLNARIIGYTIILIKTK